MDSILIAIGAGVLYLVAYHTYGRWIGRAIFSLDSGRPTPAVTMEDGRDYVPSRRGVVFGHHFTSIAGTGPIVGPAIAVIWGWLPALLWVLIGSIFVGAVHDLATLVISLRNKGRTIGDLCGDIINRRVRLLFLAIILFALWLIIAIFGLVIAVLFNLYPQSVLAVWIQIPVAVALGWLVFRCGWNLTLTSIAALAIMIGTAWFSTIYPPLQIVVSSTGDAIAGGPTIIPMPYLSPALFWTLLLLLYCYFASTLPVQWLLQPRDFVNSLQLILIMGLLCVGMFLTAPAMVAPAMNLHTDDPATPPWLPFLFITIACGACSGFHCLVSSGVSSKQLRSEADARFVGYGAMLLEGGLAVIVILACAAGIGLGFNGLTGAEAFQANYASWGENLSLGARLAPFIEGGANMMQAIPFVSRPFALALLGIFVATFAATTLDSATRLQRYVISELARSVELPIFSGRYTATFIAVATAFFLAAHDVFRADTLSEGLRTGGAGGLNLWPMFGATNQLLAGLALMVATVWLHRLRKPIWITAIPMIFMLGMTGWALISQVITFAGVGAEPRYGLMTIGIVVFVLQSWMIVEATLYVLRKGQSRKARELNTRTT